MAENFLNRLARNPYAPIDAASVTRIDEMGNGLDDWGNIIAQAPQQPQAQSWGELGYGIATAPMRFGNALAQSVNPYKGNEHPITQPDASSWQVPPLLSESWDAINSFGNAYHNGMSEDDMRRNANIAAGLTMGGGGLAARPMEVLASNASKEASVPALASALDMSPEARLARARDMGFNTDQVLYHGTGKDFEQFNPGERANGSKRLTYLTDNPDIADIYANSQNYGLKGGGNPMIYPVFAKAEKPLVVSDKGPDGSFGWVSDNLAAALGVEHPPAGKYSTLYDEARRQGYDQVQIREMTDLGGQQTQYIPLDPSNIRSVNAAFDPSKSDSANLLAANADSRASLPALASGVGYDQDHPYLWPWR